MTDDEKLLIFEEAQARAWAMIDYEDTASTMPSTHDLFILACMYAVRALSHSLSSGGPLDSTPAQELSKAGLMLVVAYGRGNVNKEFRSGMYDSSHRFYITGGPKDPAPSVEGVVGNICYGPMYNAEGFGEIRGEHVDHFLGYMIGTILEYPDTDLLGSEI